MRKNILTLVLIACLSATAQTLPYQNPNLPARERARDLCSRLTLEEKAQLMLDESPAIPRLGIKKFYWWSEALHGAANQANVTVFPEPIGMASSWNPDLLYRVFDIASTEMRAQYHNRMDKGGEDEKFHSLSVWTPNVNIFRDPRWGRGQETYGEDPYLTSVMGTAVVRGLQGPETSKYRKLWACAKHYAVHSGPEYTRHTANVNDVSLRDLQETYLPAFKVLVQDAKVREVMCAYQRLDDAPCCASTRLLQQILRDEWGFRYLVVSDCGAVSDFHQNHKTSSDAVHAAAAGTVAGTDVECGWAYVYRSIPEAVKRGFITEQEVDKHVMRLLEGRFDLGEMDDPSLVEWSKIPYSIMSSKEHQQMALDMARQTIVLLQNKDNVLPLKPGKERIAIIGPNADNMAMMWGNYNGTPNHTVTILDGLCNEMKVKKQNVTNGKTSSGKLLYLPACDLVNDKVMDGRLGSECQMDGRKGMRGTFWNNTEMQGKPVSTEYYTAPLAVTTAGFHNFAPNVNIEDFSGKYETVFTPKQGGEYVVNVEGTGHFEVYVDGQQKQKQHTWRTTPTRTVIQAEAGHSYNIEIRYQFVKTWGADMKINIAKEKTIDYQAIIDQLRGIQTVVFAGGISPALEGEEMPVNVEGFKGGDRTSIELPRVQRDLLKALKKAGKKVIFVCCSGSAIALEPETETCDAIVQAWYAGQEGGTAVADVLFGKVNPSGKLPITFYKRTDQLPDYEDYSMKGRTYRYFEDALFPFGFGLSYTDFEVGEGKIEKNQSSNSKYAYTLTVPVRNIGKRDGSEVVQVYIRRTDDKEGPLRSLRAFQRIEVKAGQTASAVLQLDARSFEFFDPQSNAMNTRPGRYEVLYGTSSQPKDLKSMELDIKGEGPNDGLKDAYGKKFYIGVAVNQRNVSNPAQMALSRREFNSITAENDMKPQLTEPREGEFTWERADRIADFCRQNGIRLRGHCLVWHNQIGQWMYTDSEGKEVSKEVLLQRIRKHIQAIVSRYKDIVYCWDVVNEAITDDPNAENPYRQSRLYKIAGDDFIREAFRAAREADPKALLFYNDYNECDRAKRNRIYKMVKEMKADGVPIDGIGMQGHYNIYSPSAEEVDESIRLYKSVVSHIHVTELDVRVNREMGGQLQFSRDAVDISDEVKKMQEQQYESLFRTFSRHADAVECVTFWNLSDRDSWLGANNYPLPFDVNYDPKPVYPRIKDAAR